MTAWFRILMVLLAALAFASAGDNGAERVEGQAHGATLKPPVTNRPPDDWVDESEGYDVDDGMQAAGTTAYTLHQGVREDNKGKWAKTDYIHWQLNGATLKATGKVHDADSKDATIAKSEAWGAELITVEVTKGTWGWIGAKNEISFAYSYLISGDMIAEASVQLQGVAHDMKGRTHTFNLSDTRKSSVSSEAEKKTGFEEKEYANLKVYVSNTPRGSRSGVAGELGASEKKSESLAARVSRRYGSAGSDNGVSPSVVVHRSHYGVVPFEEHFAVYSDASVVLRARAGKTPDGESESTVVVDLNEFSVRNVLTAWKKSSDFPFEPVDLDPPPPPPSDPGNGGPTSGSSGGGGTGGAGGGGTEEAEEEDGCCDYGAVELTVTAPHGLEEETGSLCGWLRVALEKRVARDLVLTVEADDSVDCVGEIRIAAGDRFAMVPLIAKSAGAATIVLLDGGVAVASSGVTLSSVAVHAAPELWVTDPLRRRGVVRGIAGRDLSIVVGRLGFAGIDEQDTVVQVTAEDPAGVLGVVPAELVIPAGKTHASLTLDPMVAGTGRLRFTAGASTATLDVVLVEQGWSTPSRVTVPVGAVAPLAVRLAWPEKVARVVTAVAGGPGVATCESEMRLQPGESVWFLRVRGCATGTTTVRLSTPGLPDRIVTVAVSAPTITVADGALVITGLTPLTDGVIELWVADDASISLPATPAGNGITWKQKGDAHVVLRIRPHPDRLSQATMPLQLGGEPAELGVLDRREQEASLNSFHLELR